MEALSELLEKSSRLETLTQRVGYNLWQVQCLEKPLAEYYVLVELAKLGMGVEAGEKLVASAEANTFGKTVRLLKDAGRLDAKLVPRFDELVKERNWLAHRSRKDCHDAVWTGRGSSKPRSG